MGARLTGYRAQLAGALRAVTVTSPTSYAWFGRRSRALPGAVAEALAPGIPREYLVATLQDELYRSFYCEGRPVPTRPEHHVPAGADRAFVAALSGANAGSGGWEPGWHVERVDGEGIRVAKDGLGVRARARDCRGPCAPGGRVALRRPKELLGRVPGGYLALGDASFEPGPAGMELRVYFSVTAAGAAPLVAASTRRLNAARIPFTLKVIDHPTGFTRCDAAVLYLRPADFARAREALSDVVSACSAHLRDEGPAFARRLARGVSAGEHIPALGHSFGTGRCRLFAEGIVTAHERRERRLEARIGAVERCFAERGLDIDVPYLAPGSTARYAL